MASALTDTEQLLSRLRALEDIVNNAPGLRSLYIGGDMCLVRLFNGRRLYVDSRDINHGQELMITGRWERANTALLQALVKPGDTFIDIGANFGYFSMVAGPLIGASGKLHCFEPIPRVAELLRRSLKGNGYLQGVAKIYPMAVGAARGKLQLRFKEGDYSGASLYISDARAKTDGFSAVDVEIAPLDEVLAHLSAADFVKIDAEGSEIHVLEGMKALIARSPSIKILLEFNPGSIAKHRPVAELVDALERDFVVHKVQPNGLERVDARTLPAGNHYLCLAKAALRLHWQL